MGIYAADLEMTKEEAKEKIKDIFDAIKVCELTDYEVWSYFEDLEELKDYIKDEEKDPVYAVIDVDNKTFTVYNFEPVIKTEILLQEKGKVLVKKVAMVKKSK